jgi:hypothetical protein
LYTSDFGSDSWGEVVRGNALCEELRKVFICVKAWVVVLKKLKWRIFLISPRWEIIPILMSCLALAANINRPAYLGSLEAIFSLLLSLFLIPNGCEFFVWASVASQLDLRVFDRATWDRNGFGSGGGHLV